jgi:hypothetical protein
VLLHIGVSKVKIATLGAMESHLSLLCLEVDVAFVTYNGLSLVQGLSKAAGFSEGVGTCGGAHVSVLSLKGLSVDGDGSSLGVVALRNPLSKLVISSLGSASEHAGLDGEIFVAICVTHKLAVLRLHNFTADSVLVEGHLD